MKVKIVLPLLIAGAGIGYLCGLSVTPVIQVVLTSIVTLAVSAVGILAGIDRSDSGASGAESNSRRTKIKVDVLPISMIVLGIALGASAGIYVRANNFLGWKTAESSEADPVTQARLGVLYSESIDFCNSICGEKDESLRDKMELTTNTRLRQLVDSTKTDDLEVLKLYICPKCQ